MRLPEYCATHTLKEFMEMMEPEMSKINRMAIPVTKIGPDFYVDNTRIGETVCGCNRPDCISCGYIDRAIEELKKDDCRLETCIGQCDCEKIEQCKYSPEYYLRNTKVAEVLDVLDGLEQEVICTYHYYGLDKPID